MIVIIGSTIGWNNTMHRIIAKGIEGELYAGNPERVAEIANDVYLQDEPWRCPCRETLLLTPIIPGRFFGSRSERLD